MPFTSLVTLHTCALIFVVAPSFAPCAGAWKNPARATARAGFSRLPRTRRLAL